MPSLTVENFSCIKSATLELGDLTVIIGPQASGKSVLCKLCFFFLDLINLQGQSLAKRRSIEDFRETVAEKFSEWFPANAWGTEKFRIEFAAGLFNVSLSRNTYRGQVSAKFRIKFSEEYELVYDYMLRTAESSKHDFDDPDDFRYEYGLLEQGRRRMAELMGANAILHQIFIPAGRSFFTSIGKAISAFEQGKVLDPLVLRFGRMYASYSERRAFAADTKSSKKARQLLMRDFSQLLGGQVEQDGDRRLLRMLDGRRIPVGAMSSGQQELLPLMTVMPWLLVGKSRLCYIEEPEAHLFPASQSQLIQSLVLASRSSGETARLVMTTHSPYVVTKINNLLKAGSLSRRADPETLRAIGAIVPQGAWLYTEKVRAYALRNGDLISIIGSDGLVDADYLDEVSSTMSTEFSKLLALEESLV